MSLVIYLSVIRTEGAKQNLERAKKGLKNGRKAGLKSRKSAKEIQQKTC